MGHIKDDELILKIAKLLRELRDSKNLSQEVVFFDTGIHIGRIELGKQNITVSTLNALCNYYNITLYEFISKVSNQ